MIIQQTVALTIILILIWRAIARYRKKDITRQEFFYWLVFWLVISLAVIFLKQIDAWVESLGFEAKGLDVLVYAAVVFLFYLIFRIYIRIEKLEKNITKVVRRIALDEKEK